MIDDKAELQNLYYIYLCLFVYFFLQSRILICSSASILRSLSIRTVKDGTGRIPPHALTRTVSAIANAKTYNQPCASRNPSTISKLIFDLRKG